MVRLGRGKDPLLHQHGRGGDGEGVCPVEMGDDLKPTRRASDLQDVVARLGGWMHAQEGAVERIAEVAELEAEEEGRREGDVGEIFLPGHQLALFFRRLAVRVG